MKTITLGAFLGISLLINMLLASALIYNILNGYPEARFGEYGRLNRDIKIYILTDGRKIFATLPKGLLVKNTSANGMDYFEPHRFKIIVTSDENDLVDYSIDQNDAKDGNYYSAIINDKK